jgi:hypothetical protein
MPQALSNEAVEPSCSDPEMVKAEDAELVSGEIDGAAELIAAATSHNSASAYHGCSVATSLDSLRDDMERLFHDRFPQAKFKRHPDCDTDPHIWSDLDLQLNHLECCHPLVRQEMLKRIYKKVNYVREDGEPGYWNNQRSWSSYDARATILALSNYEGRERFCWCGFPRKDWLSSACHDIIFCPRCCFNLRTEPILEEYGDCFEADQEAWFITLSLSRDAREESRFIFRDLTRPEIERIKADGLVDIYCEKTALKFLEPEDYEQCQAFWDIFRKVMEQANNTGWLSGVVGAPELAVRFMPLGVLPHAHYVAFSPGFCADYARAMRRIAKQLIRQCRRISDKMHPSIAAYRITSKEDYRAVLKYCFKPIALELAYGYAASGLPNAACPMDVLNGETNTFLEGIDLAFYTVWRVHRYGICHAGCTHYCGHVTPEREEKRKREQERRRKKKARQAELEAAFPGNKRKKRKLTQEEKADRRKMRIQYKHLVRDGEIPATAPRRFRRTKTKPSIPAQVGGLLAQQEPILPTVPKTPPVPLSPELRRIIEKLRTHTRPAATSPGGKGAPARLEEIEAGQLPRELAN